MKRKIFWNICLAAALSAAFTMVITSALLSSRVQKHLGEQVRVDALRAAQLINIYGRDFISGITVADTNENATIIAEDGTPAYDTAEDISLMPNQAQMPEIIQAGATGYGMAARISHDMKTQNIYYAVRLSDGGYVRVSGSVDRLQKVIYDAIPYCLAATAVFLLAMFIYINRQVGKMIAPINLIDPQHPMLWDKYPELSPLIKSLERHNAHMKRQFDDAKGRQREFGFITEAMNEGLVIIDEDDHIIFINQRAGNIFRTQPGKVIGEHLLRLSRDYNLLSAWNAARGGKSGGGIMRSGARQYQIFASGIDAREGTRGTVLLLLDITDQIENEKLRREFSANVSHELKTPLTAICGYAELIENGIARPEDTKEFGKRILDEGRRLLAMIQNIIKISSLDEGPNQLLREQVDIYAVAQAVIDRLQEFSGDIKITLHGQAGLHVYGNPPLLDELIHNLCENAIKYNKPGGNVDIYTDAAAQGVSLIVEDTGVGISPEHHSRIFERFYRVDKSRSKKNGGNGLGLSIVKYIAKIHDADIKLSSRPGIGTRVQVMFNNFDCRGRVGINQETTQ